jgi:hypothetical protein
MEQLHSLRLVFRLVNPTAQGHIHRGVILMGHRLHMSLLRLDLRMATMRERQRLTVTMTRQQKLVQHLLPLVLLKTTMGVLLIRQPLLILQVI